MKFILMRIKLITLACCLLSSLCYGQGTQTYNYATQSVGTGSSHDYAAVTYDLSANSGNQSTSFTVTTTLSGTGNSSYFVNLIINGTPYQLGRVTSSGSGILPITGQLTIPLSNTSHSIVVQLFAGTATTFTTPTLIVTPSDSQTILTDIATLQSTISSLNTALTTQGTTLSGLQTDLSTLQTSLSGLQTQLNALDTAVAAIPTTSSTTGGVDAQTTAQLNALASSINDLNRQLETIEDNSNPLSPTNLSLSIGPAFGAALMGSGINAFTNGALSFPGGTGIPASSGDARPGYYE